MKTNPHLGVVEIFGEYRLVDSGSQFFSIALKCAQKAMNLSFFSVSGDF